jgi:putative ABC transport system ATP-binding protein
MSVVVKDLVLRYGAQDVLDLPLWQVAMGQQGLLAGSSGSGKTTLLYALGGLIPAHKGAITIANENITALSTGALDKWRGQQIGFVFQELHVIPHLSALQNILLAGQMAHKPIDATWLERVVTMLDLKKLLSRFGYQLSTGEKQRIAIARAIVHHPVLLLADEPTSGLDDRNAFAVLDLLQQAATTAGATLLIATHDSRLKDNLPTLLELGGRK